MTEPVSSQQVHALFMSVLREQLPPEDWSLLNRISNVLGGWQAAGTDGAVMTLCEELAIQSTATRLRFRRACELSDAIQGVVRCCVAPSHVQATAAKLAEAGQRPLPAKTYPPYPQVQLSVDDTGPPPRRSPDQLLALSRLGELLACSEPDAAAIRRCLLAVWQAPDAAEVSKIGTSSVSLPDWLAAEMPALNDNFANQVHIDPRFANFVPFFVLDRLADAGVSGSQWFRRALAGQLLALGHLHSRVLALAEQLSQHSSHTAFGRRGETLNSRLSLSSPADAQRIERDYPGQLLRQICVHIAVRIERSIARCRELMSSLRSASYSRPDLIPMVPSPAGQAYQGIAQLLLDLKQLHQAVNETYGGVAYSSDARSVLVAAGTLRFRGMANNLALSAELLEDAAGELALRAGLATDPLAVMPDDAALELTGLLCTEPEKLVRVLDAGSLTPETRRILALLRAVGHGLSAIDPEACTALIVRGTQRASEILAALACLKVIDAAAAGHHGNSLFGRVSLVLDAPASEVSGLLDRLSEMTPWNEYTASRGGHIEFLISPSESPRFRSCDRCCDRLTLRRAASEIASAATDLKMLPTFVLPLERPELLAELIDDLPQATVQQHIRAIVPAESVDDLLAAPCCFRDLGDKSLAAVTNHCWLADSADAASEDANWSQLIEAMDSAWDSFAGQPAGDERPDVKLPQQLAEALRPWFGIGNASKLATGLATKDLPRWLHRRLTTAAGAMSSTPLRLLNLLAWQLLPKGSYGLVWSRIESEWHSSLKTLEAISMRQLAEADRPSNAPFNELRQILDTIPE